MPRYFALIPAAGTGSRLGGPRPKQYHALNGRPMLWHAMRPFHRHPRIERIYLVLSADDPWFGQLRWNEFEPKLQVLPVGGASRAESVRNGLRAIAGKLAPEDQVLVHDAARPCLADAQIDELIAKVGADPAGGLLAEPLSDTLKRAADDGRIQRTEPREQMWRAQTPQMFRYDVLTRALAADLEGVTDEASAVERLGLGPVLVKSDAANLKVTYAQDVGLAEAILKNRAGEAAGMRIGQGFDVHALVEGRPLIIGGVTIPHAKGLAGHSDADVLLHAVCDALLGAAGLGDIGRHFPDTDPAYKGADSRVLLREVARLLAARGCRIENIDGTIIAQAPKMAPHMPAMAANIAADLGIEATRVNVKAKTTESLGFAGRGEGIAAEAVALLAWSARV